MADVPAFGQWGTVSFAIPDFLEDIRDTINDFAELLITYLEIANTVLEFAKAFIKGFIDPLAALIEAIIAEIVAILDDLRQIGIYITGDWALLGWPPEDLRGGFTAYERRMIARLTDRTDPTRPDVSSKTSVFGFFTYLSVDPSDFEQLVSFINSIIRLFGLSFFPDTSRLPTPTIREINYGTDAVGVGSAFTLGRVLTSTGGTPPPLVRLTWVTQPPSEKHPLNPFPQLGPSGYLVTVSTLENGIPLTFARPKRNTETKPAQGDESKKAQPREYGKVLGKDMQPVILHGGAEMLALAGTRFEYNKHQQANGTPRDGSCQVFGLLNPAENNPLPLEELGTASELGRPGDGRGEDFLLQRTFLVESDTALAQWFFGETNLSLDIKDMPQQARVVREPGGSGRVRLEPDGVATHYYVRVWSVGKEIAERRAVPQWDFESSEVQQNADTSGAPFIVDMKSGVDAVSLPSQARKITFVNANTQEYLRALRAALLVLVLSRADLPVLDEIEATKGSETADAYRQGGWPGLGFAVERTGLEASRALISLLQPNPEELSKAGQDPVAWALALYERINQVALDIYERTGPMPDVERAVVEATADLRAFRWSDLMGASIASGLDGVEVNKFIEDVWGGDTEPPLFEALNPDGKLLQQTTHGIAPNIRSLGMDAGDVDELFLARNVLLDREPDFVVWGGGSELDITYEESDPAAVQTLMQDAPEGLRSVYEKFVQEAGNLLVPESFRQMLEQVKAGRRTVSSGDLTPVFFFNKPGLIEATEKTEVPSGVVVFTRGALRQAEFEGGTATIFTQAALALNAATAAATRAPEDGEWIALRLFDAFPELEEFLTMIENWARGLAEAVRSMADAIVKYIEFLQAQIVELQQLIRRINGFIQSLLQFAFALPQFSGLALLSNGTDGLMSDLQSADNKPSDTPLAYGGGVGLVIPFAPSFILDLIAVASGSDAVTNGQFDPSKVTLVERPPQAIGVEEVQPTPAPADDADVL